MAYKKSGRVRCRWLIPLAFLPILAGGVWWLAQTGYVINEFNAERLAAGQTLAEVEQILGGPERAEGGLNQEMEKVRVTFGHGIHYRDENGFRYHVFLVNDSSFWDRHPQNTGPWTSRLWASPRVFVNVTFDNQDRVAEIQIFRWRREPATWTDRVLSWITGPR